jgi:aspartyl-tRNA(Asn)/glutamyl-tRNA(Gln) amidotransferase subunit A
MPFSTIRDAGVALRSGELTSVELTTRCLERADRHDGWVGSFLDRFHDAALQRAKLADEELAAGVDHGPLHGVPVGIKDIVVAAEGPTTAQSIVHDHDWGAGTDAPVTRRLRDAGAVIVGKTTTMEFAVGLPDPSKPFPVPRNPWDRSKWAGGSSSGTGSGVAAGFFLGGVGTDTGGSIRIPAAYCGVSGLMPTFGLVPKSGVVPLGYSLDHVGPLARSAWDCAVMLQAMAGFHASDPDSVSHDVPDYLAGLERGLGGMRIGVVREHHIDAADSGVADAFEEAVAALAASGADVREVSIPLYYEVTSASLVTMAAEACAYHQNDLRARWGDYAKGTRGLVPWGALVSGADYVQAQRVRRAGQRALNVMFEDVDVLVAPTTGTPAADLDKEVDLENTFARIFTPYWDAVGNPVLAVPVGFVDEMPVSMQIAGRAFAESAVLAVGHAYQQVTDWHLRTPDLEVAHG